MWRDGRRAGLLDALIRDREAATRRSGRRRERGSARRTLAAEVCELVEEGQLSRASGRLSSLGLAGLTPRIVQQLASKHPRRRVPMPAVVAGDFPRAVLHLEETFRTLPRRAGQPISGSRNEYLIALTRSFEEGSRAASVMDRYDSFATDAAAIAYPDWFYLVWGAARLVPLVKARVAPGVEPDARPICISEPDLSAVLRALVRPEAPAIAAYLRPQQVAVGVSGGISIAVHGITMLLRARPGFVCVRIDLRNAYNSMCRAAALRRVIASGCLAAAVPLLHRLGGPEGLLFVRDADGVRRLFDALAAVLGEAAAAASRGDSSDGELQGRSPASSVFCIGIHREVVALDRELAIWGGFARFISDDGYAAAPAHVVFPAVARFIARVGELLFLEGQWAKFRCFSHGHPLDTCPHRIAHGVAVGTLSALEVDAAVDSFAADLDEDARRSLYVPARIMDAGTGRGIMVGGVPVGDDQYIRLALWEQTSRSVSSLKLLTSQLRPAHYHAWSLLHYCISPELDYWLRHLPSPATSESAARFDRAIIAAVEALTYHGCIEDFHHRELLMECLSLPQRMGGAARRRRVALADVCYASCFIESAEAFLGPAGYFPMLHDVFGVQAGVACFAAGGTRFAAFIDSPLGATFSETWERLRAAALHLGLPGTPARSGPLSLEAGRAGESRSERLQHAITAQLETLRGASIRERMRALDPASPRSAAFRQAFFQRDGRTSMQWVSAYPTADCPVNGDEFSIGFCQSFGLPIGQLRGHVGSIVPCSSQRRQPRACDPEGYQLAIAVQPGAHMAIIHDMILHEEQRWMRLCGVRYEGQPLRLFAGAMPPAQRDGDYDDDPEAVHRRGIIPDDLTYGVPGPRGEPVYRRAAGRRISDTKVLHGGHHTCYSVQRDRETRCGAVEVRARQVPVAYERAARYLDEHAVEPARRVAARDVLDGAAPGPVLSALRDFPPCEGRCYGAYAEMSSACHRLFDHMATTGATLRWRSMGARDEAEARGFLVQAIRRSLGVMAWRCQARMVLWRLSTVGVARLPTRAPRVAAPTGPAAEQLRLDAAELSRLFFAGMAPVARPAGPLRA